MSANKLRWGILSTAHIARKNWKAIHNSGNGTVVSVASRDLRRAQQFIEERQADAPMEAVPRAVGSYEELLAAADVDAVYIPLPTGLRKEWVLRAAAAGKHVVCEKPCANSVADLIEMIEACRKNGVLFMDGVMFMHSARMKQLRQVLDDGSSVGTIRRIVSQFSFCAADEWVQSNIRASSQLEPAGCLGDLGWYTIRIILWALNFEMPTEVRGRTLHGAKRPDSAELLVTLDRRPTQAVTIAVELALPGASIEPALLTFSPENWGTAQRVQLSWSGSAPHSLRTSLRLRPVEGGANFRMFFLPEASARPSSGIELAR